MSKPRINFDHELTDTIMAAMECEADYLAKGGNDAGLLENCRAVQEGLKQKLSTTWRIDLPDDPVDSLSELIDVVVDTISEHGGHEQAALMIVVQRAIYDEFLEK